MKNYVTEMVSVHRHEYVEKDYEYGESYCETDDQLGAEFEGFVILGIEVPDKSCLWLESTVVFLGHVEEYRKSVY